MRISDWSSDVCSSDLAATLFLLGLGLRIHARLVRGCVPLGEREAPRIRAGSIGAARLRHPLPVEALVADLQRRAGQAREQPGPDPHRAGGAVQAGHLVLVVADPDHGEVVAGVAGKPAVAAVVAGAGLAGGIQAAKTVADQLVRGAVADRALQRGGRSAEHTEGRRVRKGGGRTGRVRWAAY